MRNKKWYLAILKGKTMEWAYRFITDNLKAPSFMYEQQNAYAAYKEVFGADFASPEEIQAKSDKEEIERLKAELEAVKAQKQETVKVVTDFTDKEVFIVDPPITENIGIITKEQFYNLHVELKGAAKSKAWAEYAKEKGIEK